MSRDSSRSVNSRAVRDHTIPIEFRTLSFGVSESQAVADNTGKTKSRSKVTATKEKAPANDFAQADEHAIDLDQLTDRLGVSCSQGLTADVASKRLVEDGKNILPSHKPSYIKKLLSYVFGGFCSILWIGVIIFFICWRPLGDPDPQPYNLGLAILVIIVIVLQALFSAFQDWSTAKTMNAILDLLPSDALVLRHGSFVELRTSELVRGDIVKISIGDKVPADLRLIETSGDLRFDRSAMTGESHEIDGTVDKTDDNFLETRNVALMGTIVTNGSGTGIVVFTGARSVMGSIAAATADVPERPTSIQREITRFVTIIVGLTVVLALLILLTWAGWLHRDMPGYMSVVAMLNNVMGCVVAFIPEGMPVGVALTLMMIARRMKAADVLPKSLATVEMLGCVEVIASDKTGTLTRNQMTVTSVAFVDQPMKADDARQAIPNGNVAISELHRTALLCNEGSFAPETLHKPIDERAVQGNATDGAILKFAEGALDGAVIRARYPRVAHLAFNSKNKFMVTLHSHETEPTSEKQLLALVKGAPDVLLPKCSHYYSYQTNDILTLDASARESFQSLQSQLSRNAERVIMLCQRRYAPVAPLGSNDLQEELQEHCVAGLTIIGVVGIFDPPREETARTVAACRRAGIRFFMMTGDFGLTAAAIARQVGIFSGEHDPDTLAVLQSRRSSTEAPEKDDSLHSNQSLLLEAGQISALEDDDWDLACVYEEIVFARCSPEQKLTIVKQFKKRGITTAVTGDGVNDAPAMKAADVGVAMVNGSDVALEAADLVLLGSFESIVTGVRLGRLVFQNLQKVISYLLPAGSWSEIWPVLLNVFLGVPLPLSSFLMIIICVFTDLFLSLSLIMEQEEFDLLTQPPRNVKKTHLINLKIYAQSYVFIGVMETICAHAMYFFYYWKHAGIPVSAMFLAFEKYSDGFYGYTQDQLNQFNVVGQSVYFATLVILQLGNILSIRNKRLSILQADPIRKQRRNPWLILSALISISIAIFVTEVPGIQSLFGTGSVPIEFWFLPLPLALGILIMDEIRKLAVRTWPKGPLAKIAW
ncbi:hypothetical protein ANO11243_042560 [Dothideomycetidae sp. 11243]|nr:hypothetical protein ANO11243_042560 [fungal sp. No.11243]